jgi:ABC-2 type transport system ATP-binding protein
MSAPVIEVSRLVKRYAVVVAVNDVSFTVERGAVYGLLGGNGAGKTTTLSILLGLLLPTSGTVRVLGEDIVRHRERVATRINFSSPYVDLPHRLTVGENLAVYARLYGVRDRVRRLAELGEQLDFAQLMKRRYGDLSAGQKTRVGLAKALLNRPELLLLDEPTASLDPDSADRMRALLLAYQRESGATVLLASHNMLEVERLCTEVAVMRAGTIVDRGAPAALLARYGRHTMEDVFLDIARGADDADRSRSQRASS